MGLVAQQVQGGRRKRLRPSSQLDPGYATASNNRGITYDGRDHYGRAVQDYDPAISHPIIVALCLTKDSEVSYTMRLEF